jgi:Flp pilus assembly protein TadD
MPSRLRNWFLFPVRHPDLGLLAALVLGVAGYLLWQGARVLWSHRDRAAAERALEEYDFPEARRRLADCIRLRPDDPAVRLLAAQAARRDGDLEAAEEQLDRCDRLTGGPTSDAKLERKMLLAQYGQVAPADPVVGDLIALLEVRHPASEQILEALAMGCVRVYRLDLASFWIEELQKRFPKNPTGRLIFAQTLETFGNRDRALGVLRELVQEYPKQAKARLHLAGSLFQSRQYEEAATHYEELRRQQPGQLLPLLGLARCRARLDQSDAARPLMRELEERHADNSEALLECGRFALGEQRLADAERLLRRAAELAPNDHEVHLHLGACLQQLDKPDEARSHLDRAKQIEADLIRLETVVKAVLQKPDDPEPRLEAGRICLRNGQTAEALRWLHGVLEIVPDPGPAHEALADAYEQAGRPDLAAHHRRLAQGDPAALLPAAPPAPGASRRP